MTGVMVHHTLMTVDLRHLHIALAVVMTVAEVCDMLRTRLFLMLATRARVSV